MRRLAVAVALLIAVALGVVLLGRTRLVRDYVRRGIVAALSDALDADVRLGRVEGSLLERLVLHDLRVAVGGHEVVHVPRIEAVYVLRGLLRGVVQLERLILTSPRVRLERTARGWSLPAPRAGGGGGLVTALHVRRLEVHDGRVAVALRDQDPPRRLAATAIEADAVGSVDARGSRLGVTSLRFMPRGVGVTPVEAVAEVLVRGDGVRVRGLRVTTARSRLRASADIVPRRSLAAYLALDPLDVEELRALVPTVQLLGDVRGMVEARGPWSALRLVARGDVDGAGAVATAARLDLEVEPLAYRARARFAGLDPGAAFAGLPRARAHGSLRARGRGIDRRAVLSYDLALAPSEIAGYRLQAAALGGRLSRRGVNGRGRLSVMAGEAAVRSRVIFAPPVAYRAAARVRLHDLASAVPGLPGWAAGRIAVEGRGADASTRRATARVRVSGASLRGVTVSGAEATVHLDGDHVTLPGLVVDGPGLHASAAGAADPRQRRLEVSGEGQADLAALGTPAAGELHAAATVRGPFDALAVSATARAESLHSDAVSTGVASAELDLRGLGGGAPSSSARLRAEGAQVGTGPPKVLTVAAHWERRRGEDRVRLEGTWPSAEIAFAGQRAATGNTEASFAVAGLELAPWCALAGFGVCGGTLSGRATVTGTASNPRLEAALTVTELSAWGIAYGTLDVEARHDNRRLDLAGSLRHPSGGALVLEGSVPIDLAWAGPRRDLREAPLDIRVRGEGLDLALLRVLAPAHVEEASGPVEIDLRVTGSRALPRAAGRIAIDGHRLRLAGVGVTYEGLRLRATGADGNLEVEEISARAATGRVMGQGTIGIGDGASAPLALELRAEDFQAVSRDSFEAAFTGTVQVRGSREAPEVSGDLDVVRAIIRPSALPGPGSDLEPDPTIVLLNAPEETGPAREPPPPFLNALRLALAMHARGDVRIIRADANIELGGDLEVLKEPFAPLWLNGRIILVRGWYSFQGRRFVIDEGTITFVRTSPQPILNVRARYRTRDYLILVRVEGAADRPRLTLASDPPLDQADVLSVLLFGKPTDDLRRGESASLRLNALRLASGYAVPGLRDALHLDTMEVELPAQRTGDGRVTVGRYLTDDVFLSLGQSFGSEPAQLVGIEYDLTRSISVRGSSSTRGRSAIDLFWRRRY